MRLCLHSVWTLTTLTVSLARDARYCRLSAEADENVLVTPEKQEALARDPEGYLKMRKVIEDGGNLIHDSTIRGTDMQKQFVAEFTTSMKQRLAKKPELFDAIIPTFMPGCRRLTPGKGYLEALTEDNVEVCKETIVEITETGVKLASGRLVEVDALACATGFRTSAPPNFEVVGRDGLTLTQRWQPHPESYMSVMVDGFPNYLMMFGPNSAIGFGSLTKILENECDYCIKVLRKLQKEDYATIEPKKERVQDFQQYIGAYFSNTVYVDKCKSWYRSEGGQGNWIIGLWPGSTLHALDALRSPRWEDFGTSARGPLVLKKLTADKPSQSMRARILRGMHCAGLVMAGLSLRRRVILRGTSIRVKLTGLWKASRKIIPSLKLDRGHIKWWRNMRRLGRNGAIDVLKYSMKPKIVDTKSPFPV